MNKKCLLIFTWFFSLHCFAQDTVSKFSVEISIGPSFPMGEFADKNYSEVTNSRGLAKTGYGVDLNIKLDLDANLGLLVTAGYSSNKQDPKSVENYINKGANFPAKSSIEMNAWNISKILAGFYYHEKTKN